MSKEDMVCPQCGSTKFFFDDERGEIVCNNCGLVVEETLLVESPEFDDNQNKIKSGGKLDPSLKSQKSKDKLEEKKRKIREKKRKIKGKTEEVKKQKRELEKEKEDIKEELEKQAEAERNLKEILKEVDEEIAKAIEEGSDNVEGLRNLRKELEVIGTRKKDNKPSREEEAPGTLRVVKEVYERAGYISEIGKKNDDGKIVYEPGEAVHHFDGFNYDVDKRIDPDNLILLSKEIHDEFHELMGAGNNTIEQFTEFLLLRHPEAIPAFREKYLNKYLEKYGAPLIVDDKIDKSSEKWDSTTWDKQYRRHLKIPFRKDLHEIANKPKLSNISYSSFFLKNMDVPIEGSYKIKDSDVKFANLSTSDDLALSLYEEKMREEFESYGEKGEDGKYIVSDDELRNILTSRRFVEATYGLYDGKSMDELLEGGVFKNYDRKKLLEELEDSYGIGRKRLEDRIRGEVDIPFKPLEKREADPNRISSILSDLGAGDGKYKSKNLPNLLGSGLIPVLNDLKDFFELNKEIFGGRNPLKNWDASGDISPGSPNEKLITGLFEKGGIDYLLDKVTRHLPVDDTTGLDGTPKRRVIRFNAERKEDGHPPIQDIWHGVRTNLQYLSGIAHYGISNESITRYFLPDGRRASLSNKDLQNAGLYRASDGMKDILVRSEDAFEGEPRDRSGDYLPLVEGGDTWNDENPLDSHNYRGKTNVFLDEAMMPGDKKMSDAKIDLEELKEFKDSVDKINSSLNTLSSTIESALGAFARAMGIEMPKPKKFDTSSVPSGSVEEMLKEKGVNTDTNPIPNPSLREVPDIFRYSTDEIQAIYKKRVRDYEYLLKQDLSERTRQIVERALKVASRIAKEGLGSEEIFNEDIIFGFYSKPSSAIRNDEDIDLEELYESYLAEKERLKNLMMDRDEEELKAEMDALSRLIEGFGTSRGRGELFVNLTRERNFKKWNEWSFKAEKSLAEKNPLWDEYQSAKKKENAIKNELSSLLPNQDPKGKKKLQEELKEAKSYSNKLYHKIYDPIERVMDMIRENFALTKFEEGEKTSMNRKTLKEFRNRYEKLVSSLGGANYEVYLMQGTALNSLMDGDFAEMNNEITNAHLKYREARIRKAEAYKKWQEALKKENNETKEEIDALYTQYRDESINYNKAFEELTSFARDNRLPASPFIEQAFKDIRMYKRHINFWQRKIDEGAKSPKQEGYFYAKRKEAEKELEKAIERLNKLGGSIARFGENVFSSEMVQELSAMGLKLEDLDESSTAYFGGISQGTMSNVLKTGGKDIGDYVDTYTAIPDRRPKKLQERLDVANAKSENYESDLSNVTHNLHNRWEYLFARFDDLKKQIQIKREDILSPDATDEVKEEYDALVKNIQGVVGGIISSMETYNDKVLDYLFGDDVENKQLFLRQQSGLIKQYEKELKDLSLTADEVIEKTENLREGLGGGFSDLMYSRVNRYVYENIPNQEPTLYNTNVSEILSGFSDEEMRGEDVNTIRIGYNHDLEQVHLDYLRDRFTELKTEIENLSPRIISPDVTEEDKKEFDSLIEHMNRVWEEFINRTFSKYSELLELYNKAQEDYNRLLENPTGNAWEDARNIQSKWNELTTLREQLDNVKELQRSINRQIGISGSAIDQVVDSADDLINKTKEAQAVAEEALKARERVNMSALDILMGKQADGSYLSNQKKEEGFATETIWGNYANALNELMNKREELARLASNPILFNVSDVEGLRRELALIDEIIKSITSRDNKDISALLRPLRGDNVAMEESSWANYGSMGGIDLLSNLLKNRNDLVNKLKNTSSAFFDLKGTQEAIESLKNVEKVIEEQFPDNKIDISLIINPKPVRADHITMEEGAFANYNNLNLEALSIWEDEYDANLSNTWEKYRATVSRLIGERDKAIAKLQNLPIRLDITSVQKVKEQIKSIDETIKTVFPGDSLNISLILNPKPLRADNIAYEEGSWANYNTLNMDDVFNNVLKKRDELVERIRNTSIAFFDLKGTQEAIESLKKVEEVIEEQFPDHKIDISLIIEPKPVRADNIGYEEGKWANYGNTSAVDTLLINRALDFNELKGSFNINTMYTNVEMMNDAFAKLSEKRERYLKAFDKTIKMGNVEGARKILDTLKMVDDAIKAMFPNDTREIDIKLLEDKVDTSRLGSDFSRFTRKIGESTRQLGGLRSALTQLFSIVGTGRVMDDMITASSLRQTNKIMLTARRGQEEANKLYDSIQALVFELPGNDTFLTNILTMLGTMDKSLTESDLKYMGGVIADYYMGAQAKGQYNNETERELRNYLMTGQTRNLTNSIIASEVESLKGLNSVKERTVALEKALQKTGMDSIAHYDSYRNTLEEFKGRFQKSFADLGDIFLGFLQMLMKIYNFVDSLTGSFLSQITIVLGVVAMGAITGTMFLGQMADSLGDLIDMYSRGRNFIFNPKDLDKYSEAIRKSIISIGLKIGVLNAETDAKIANAVATDVETSSEELNTWAKTKNFFVNIEESLARFENANVTDWETLQLWLNAEAEESSAIGKAWSAINSKWEAVSRWLNALAIDGETVSLGIYLKEKLIELWHDIRHFAIRVKDIAIRVVKIGLILAEAGALAILNGVLAFTDVLLSPIALIIIGIVAQLAIMITIIEKVGEAFGWWTDFGSMIEAFSAGIQRIWDAFMNNEKVQYAMYVIGGFFENLQAWFGRTSVLGGLYEMIFGTPGGAGDWDILGDIINFLGAIGEALWTISNLDEIIEVLRAVGAYMGWVLSQWNEFVNTQEFQDLIEGFREIRVAFGEIWKEIAPVFDELGQAWAELWDDGEYETLKEDGNEMLELFKSIARFIRDYVIPFIKMLIPLIKATLTPLVITLKVVTKIIESVKWVIDHMPDWMAPDGNVQSKAPILSNDQIHQMQQQNYGELYARGQDLAKTYNNSSNNPTIINNNFGEGSVQTNAHNMTEKEVRQLFTNAFGYNKANGVKGVLR